MTNAKCTLIVDSGADVSLFKRGKISPLQRVDPSKRFDITGITDGSTKTLAETETILHFENGLEVLHNFQIVGDDFPIPTDGILGRDFLRKYKCSIDYEYWLLKFKLNNHTIEVPIEDGVDTGFIIPNRCETIKNVHKLNISEDMVVSAQEIQPGVFCGNTIISPKNTCIKFINTTNLPVHIRHFKPIMEPLTKFNILPTKNLPKGEDSLNINEKRVSKILAEIDKESIPQFTRNAFNKLVNKYADVFCLPDESLSVNNFYSQSINLNDTIPVYVSNYKSIYSQRQEIQRQVEKMSSEGIIEPSLSPYNSPILLVPKKMNNNEKNGVWLLIFGN